MAHSRKTRRYRRLDRGAALDHGFRQPGLSWGRSLTTGKGLGWTQFRRAIELLFSRLLRGEALRGRIPNSVPVLVHERPTELLVECSTLLDQSVDTPCFHCVIPGTVSVECTGSYTFTFLHLSRRMPATATFLTLGSHTFFTHLCWFFRPWQG